MFILLGMLVLLSVSVSLNLLSRRMEKEAADEAHYKRVEFRCA